MNNLSSIFKSKSEKDIVKNISKENLNLLKQCFELIKKNPEIFTIITDLGLNTKSIGHVPYYYGFSFIQNDFYNNTYAIIYDHDENEIYLYTYKGILIDDAEEIKNIKDLLFMFSLSDKMILKENSIFKPKSQEELKQAFNLKYPLFSNIVKKYFKGNYALNINENLDAYIGFSKKDKNGNEYYFLLKQDSFRTMPTISVLDQSKAGDGYGGFFADTQSIISYEHFENYIKQHMLSKYLMPKYL